MTRTAIIQTTAAGASAELTRRGILPDQPVTLLLDVDEEIVPGRREARARVVAAGLSDKDIDRLIDDARSEAQSLIE
ncbi:MAG: hypothetical protein JO001_24435 [Alphaproteobacteria bacterium]|nr:hypothetical protein [Alphaproteobacteria bacterium]